MNYCYLNGEILHYADCRLHISDLQIQRGYGVFDFFRCRKESIPWLEDYTDRLFNSIRLAGMKVDLEKKDFNAIIDELQKRSGGCRGAFKVIVTGGYSDTLESVTGNANFIILHIPWNNPPEETFSKGVNLVSLEYRRPNPEIKTLYYFNTLRLQKKMQEYHAVDVLYHTDWITEASRANLFFVKGNTIVTPTSGILNGITRKQILTWLPETRVEDVAYKEIYAFDEMFLTSTSRDITPVVSVEGKNIGDGKPGKITKEVMALFSEKGWSSY